MRSMLTKHGERLRSVPELAITLHQTVLATEDLQLISLFPNLFKIHFDFCKFSRAWQEVLDQNLLMHARIKETVSAKDQKSDFYFGEDATHLQMTWKTDISTIQSPSSLTNSDLPFLTHLILSHTELTSLNVSYLPQTLESIEVSSNPIVEFTSEGTNPQWPPLLKSIEISTSPWTGDQLEQLSAIAWPPLLETLLMHDVSIPSLEYLRGLPESLKRLRLLRTGIETLKVSHNEDKYPFFRFPPCLVSLEIKGGFIGAVDYYRIYDSNGILIDPRIEFPSSLETLELTQCKVRELTLFSFPSSLKTLDLSSNSIKDIRTYETGQITRSIIWQDLKRLEKLDLSHNNIKCLHDWLPPPSLRKLRLRANWFSEVDPSSSIIFQKRYHKYSDKLSTLDLGSNWITCIPRDLALPRNLLYLRLDNNHISSFEFTDEIASHENLIELELNYNRISEVTLENPAKQYSMNLLGFDLRFNSGTPTMSVEELYVVLRQLGHTITEYSAGFLEYHIFD